MKPTHGGSDWSVAPQNRPRQARPSRSGKGHSRCFIAALVALAALSPLHADTYHFIVSGYPAANESYPAASAGTALATTTRSGKSAASPLEARFRTWLESLGTALKSTRFCGFFMDIK